MHEGFTPRYSELRRARLIGKRDHLVIVLGVAGELPARLAEGVRMGAGVRLSLAQGEVSVTARGTEQGWRVHAKDRRGRKRPVEAQISGRRILFRVPWSLLGGAQRFTWLASAAWHDSGSAYSIDLIPNSGGAAFPGD